MTVTRITRAVYAFLGIVYVLLGTGSMLLPAGWLPQGLADRVFDVEIPNALWGHFIQEFGTLALALGFVFLWCASHQKPNRVFHWAMTLYFAFDAVIHWFDPEGFSGSWTRGMVNTVPFLVMLLLGVGLQRESERSRRQGAT